MNEGEVLTIGSLVDEEVDETVVWMRLDQRGWKLFLRDPSAESWSEERLNECNLALGSFERCMDEFWWDCEIESELKSPWKLKYIVLVSEWSADQRAGSAAVKRA